MPSQQTIVIQDGITTLGALGIVFVVAKLFGWLDWSWWGVLIPFYIGPLMMFVIVAGFLFVCAVIVIFAAVGSLLDWKSW